MNRLLELLPQMAPRPAEPVPGDWSAPAEEKQKQTASPSEVPQTVPAEEAETPEHREKRLKREADRVAFYNLAEGGRQHRDGLDCPVCRNKGYYYRMTEEGDMVALQCACMARRKTLQKIRESGLGTMIRDYTFDNFETREPWQAELKEQAQAFCADPDAGWFYVGGQVGSGKTHICTAICADYLRRGFDVRYLMWAEKSKHLKALINDYHAYTDMLDEYKRVPVLYIDDFLKVRQGAEPSDGDLNLAFELINARLLRPGAVTVLSSERTLPEAMEYDEATISRICQQCGRYRIAIGRDRGRNYRLAASG